MTSLNEAILADSLVLAQQQLQSFAQGENFWSVFDSVFGTEYDRTQAEAIQQAWQASDFSQLPEIQVLDSASMPGIQGGFSAQMGKIYINAEFLANATADQIAAVLIEEIGHSLDSQVNAIDTPGDEGELFSNYVRGVSLNDSQVTATKSENDQIEVVVDGISLSLEAASHQVLNGGFEAGNLGGWSSTGAAGVSTSSIGINPVQGTYQGVLTNNGSTDATIESFLGLSFGSLDKLVAGNATEGSAIKQNVTVSAGTKLTFNWNFLNGEAQNSSYKDFAFVSIAPSSLTKLADTFSSFFTSPFLNTGYQTFTYVFPVAGTFTIGVGVLDFADTVVDSRLLVDNFSINNTPTGNPTAVLASGTEDTVYKISQASLLQGFSDPDGDTLLVANLSASNGTLGSYNSATGTYTFTPNANYNGPINVSYNVVDSYGGSVTATQSFTVNAVNDAPMVSKAIANQAATEDAIFSFTIPANIFSDVDAGDTLTYSATLGNGDPLPDWLVFDAATQTLSGTPLNEDVGNLSIKVTATDSSGALANSTFKLAIANTNDAPTLTGTSATLINGTEDTTYTINAADLLQGFSDVDTGDTLSVIDLTATNGSLINNNDGTYSFTPDANFNGTVNLAYNVVDSNGGSSAATQSFTVDAINDVPVGTASGDLLNSTEDTTYTINTADLLQGFSDVDTGDILSVSDLTATNGNLVNNNDGTYSFTPAANFNGAVSLTYNVVDGNGGSIAATQSFTVDAVNDVPVGTASANLSAGTEDTPYTINAADLLAGFSDVDGDILSIADLVATNGTLVNKNDGTYTFNPAVNFNGTVNLTYNVVDGNGGSVAATQSFTVDAVNDIPTGTASAVLINGTEDTAYTISAVDLLQGFSDVDGDTLAVADLVATDGTLINNNDGTYSFNPAANYNGSVNLSYNVVDGNGGTIAATQSFTVDAVNDAPVVSNAIATQNTLEDSPFTFTIPADTFSDVDGDPLTYTATLENGDALPSWLSFDGTTLSGTPTNDNVGNLNIEVIASDGELSVSNVFNLAIANTNDAPTATNDSLITSEDTPLVISAATLLGNDVDVDLGDILSVSEFTQPSQGSLVDNGNGTYNYSPNANYNGVDSFTYTIRDREGATSTATVNLTINAVNDNPDAINDIVTARQSTAKTILASDLLANDGDIEGDALKLTQVQNAQNGTVALDSNGDVVFTANANVATASFEYTLSDGKGGTDIAFVSVLVGMVDDGGNGQDTMNGTAGDDVLNGGNGDDILRGFAGDDKLLGGNGIDNLQGGEGKDWLYGGRGNDLLNGGLGRDTFVLISQNGTDTIQDFTDGADQIGLAEGLTFGQLTVSSSNGNTLIAKNGGDVLAILSGVNSSLITQSDFISVV